MFPLVSIVIPAYNAEKWIVDALQSAVSQTWRRTEVVVVDDGSTDGTLSAAKQFESASVRVVRAEHRGQTAALNRALSELQGDYVQYLDADDVMAPDKLAVQVKRLLAEPPDTVATCRWARFYDDDLSTAIFREHADYRDYEQPVEWLIESWGGRGTMPPVAWLLPRAVIEKAGPWNESLSLNNDTEYFTRVIIESARVAFCSEACGYYRSGNPSLSGTRARRGLESFYHACELSTSHLLAAEDSPRVRSASANLWQHFVYWVYPEAPDLVAAAEARVSKLGGSTLPLKGSWAFKASKRLIGWKATRRLQIARSRLRTGPAAALVPSSV